jgi:hypothetical protein
MRRCRGWNSDLNYTDAVAATQLTIFCAMIMLFPILTVFLAALGSGTVLARWVRSIWMTIVLALGGVALLHLVIGCMPFSSFASEVLVCFTAAILGAPVSALGIKLTKRYERPSKSFRTLIEIVLLIPFLIALIMPGFFLSFVERLRYASDVAWAADGTVGEKYLSASNHQLPTVVVRTSEGESRTFKGVDPTFFAAASVGDRIHKDGGHTHASLNGRSVVMVRERFRWFGLAQEVAPD